MDDGVEEIPPCPDCGCTAWVEELPVRLTIEEAIAAGIDWVPSTDFEEFFREFGERQADYIRKQFLAWQEEKAQRVRAEQVAVETDVGAMFRELWGIMERPE